VIALTPRLLLLATLLALGACAGSGGGLGIPSCVADRGALEAPVVRAGEAWSYRQSDDYTKIDQGVFRIEATAVDAEGIETRLTPPAGGAVTERYDPTWGWKRVSNRGWDWLSRLAGRSPTVEFTPPFDTLPYPLRAGQKWGGSVTAIDPSSGQRIAVSVDSTARCWEQIAVPAGAFVALRVERAVYLQDVEWYRSQTTLRQVEWYAPEVNRAVMTWHDSRFYDYRQRPSSALILGDRLRWELMQ
jgi:hypothetical protein